MSKSNTLETDLLQLIFKATAVSGIADNAASGALTNLYAALHTASPADTGDQTTNEVAYSGYARVAIARSSSGFTVVNNAVTPMANIDFPTCIAGTATATHFSIGRSSTGGTGILYHGSISPTVSISTGVVPRLTTATTITED
jgi:hypothetical protein